MSAAAFADKRLQFGLSDCERAASLSRVVDGVSAALRIKTTDDDDVILSPLAKAGGIPLLASRIAHQYHRLSVSQGPLQIR